MAKEKVDPVAKLIWAHMRYAESFESCGIVTQQGELFWDKQGNRLTQPEMQKKCETHQKSTVKKIRTLISKPESQI